MILDSGGVLLRPVNGRWFPCPAFYDVLADRQLAWESEALARALAGAEEYLGSVHHIPLADEAAERPVWIRFYELVCEGLELRGDVGELAEAITDRWEATLSVEPYPWTRPVLVELQDRGIPVVVLSDAWPSLRRFFRHLGLDGYLRGLVISGEEGRTKPDEAVFAKARQLLGDEVDEVVFVDDWPGHVVAAGHLGMRGVRLRHAGDEAADGVAEITDLRELIPLCRGTSPARPDGKTKPMV